MDVGQREVEFKDEEGKCLLKNSIYCLIPSALKNTAISKHKIANLSIVYSMHC